MNEKNHKAFTYIAPRVKRMSVMHTGHQKAELNQWLSSFPELAHTPDFDRHSSALSAAMDAEEQRLDKAAEDRTHWLTTFVELVYVGSMIKLGEWAPSVVVDPESIH
jgi:hypothetical protein